jgi:hypothetical protein
MISNTDGMLGGETYIKGGDGKISKVRGSNFFSIFDIKTFLLGGWAYDGTCMCSTGR